MRTELRTVLHRVRQRLDPQTEVYLRHPLSREDFALCLDELLHGLDSENWPDVLTRNYPVAYIVNLGTVMDRVPRCAGAHASPGTWEEGAGPPDPIRARGLWRRKYRGPIRPETVRILRKSLGILYSTRMELALGQLLDRLEERFDPVSIEFMSSRASWRCRIEVRMISDRREPERLLARTTPRPTTTTLRSNAGATTSDRP